MLSDRCCRAEREFDGSESSLLQSAAKSCASATDAKIRFGCSISVGISGEQFMASAQRLFDADGHVYELDYQIVEYLDPPFRGKKELLRQPLINSGDGWHRISLGVLRGSSLMGGEITAQMWIDALD